MRLVHQREYGTEYRPGLSKILADTDASPSDLARIGALIRAADTQKRVTLLKQSGALSSTTGEDNDLLDAVGAGSEKVKVADYHQQASKEKDLPWWWDVWNWANSAIHIGNDDKAEQHDSAVEDTPVLNLGVKEGLDTLARLPGFLYREVGPPPSKENTAEIQRAMKAQGYTPGNVWDEVAFNWYQGESHFNDLSAERERYGAEDVDLAVETFREGTDLRDYQATLEDQFAKAYEAGDTGTQAEVAKKIEHLTSPEFLEVYKAVDRKHWSPGRDLARAVGADYSDSAFNAVSGTTDALFTLFVDPTVVGGKVAKSVQLARWGVDSVDANKIYHMLGETDLRGVAPTKSYYLPENNLRRQGLVDFLDRAKQYRAAQEAGDAEKAAGIYAGAAKIHKDFMPLWSEVNGVRPAMTPMERAWAQANGERLVDVNGVEATGGAFRTKPVESVREFADLAANRWGLLRLQNGLAANPRALMPGKMGWQAERRANRAMAKTTERLKGMPEGAAFVFSGKGVNAIIGDEAEDALLKAAEARGRQVYDDAHQWTDKAKRLRVWADATSRRFTTVLPSNREISYHSAAAANDIRRAARAFLPKYEADMYAAMWEHGTAATRRTLAKALLRETFEASGNSRSTVGREFMDKFVNDLVDQNMRRYAFGDADMIAEAYQGERRAGLYKSQMEEGFVLPAFSQLKQIAAKAAVLGYDSGLSSFGWNAATAKRVARWGGVPAMRYMLFSSTGATRFLQATKLGWITTGSNMLRNALDEYLGLKLAKGQHGLSLARGRQTMRDAGLGSGSKEGAFERGPMARRFVGLTNHQIPRQMRAGIRTLRDATLAINKGKLDMMGKGAEWRVKIAEELHEQTVADELGEYLGGRIIDNPDEYLTMGHEFAQEMAKSGIPHEAWEFKGYKLEDILPNDGGAGLKALASMYGQRFAGDEPAHAFLAAVMRYYAKQHPEFLDDLDDSTKALLEKLAPAPGDGGMRLIRVQEPDNPAPFVPSEKPHGLYLSPDDGQKTVHAESMEANATPDPAYTKASYDRIWSDALHRTWDENGDQAIHVQVKDGDPLVVVKYDMGKGTRTEEPLKFIYRVVSVDDYTRMKKAGRLDTNGSRSHGGTAQGPQLFGSAVPTQIVKVYARDEEPHVLLKIAYKPEDGWYKEMSDGDSSYVATRQSLPFDRVDAAGTFRAEYDEATEKTTAVGFDAPNPTVEPLQEFRAYAAYAPDAPEVLRPTSFKIDVSGLRGPEHLDVDADAGVAALREILGDVDFYRFVAEARKGKKWFTAFLHGHGFGDHVDWDRYHDTYEMLMALGGIAARKKGYKAIWHEDVANPRFNEYVALTDDALIDEAQAGLPTMESLVDHLKSPQFASLRKESEHFNVDERGNRIDPGDAEGLERALKRMVPKYLTDIGMAVIGKNKAINPELASMLLRGKVPEVNELSKIGLDNLPPHAVRMQYAPKAGGFGNMVLNGYTGLMTRLYDAVVTKPIRALVRVPLYVDAYTNARFVTQKYADNLVKEFGWGRDVADAEARRIAERHALAEVVKYVDNPKVASQFSAMNKNWWGFYRAQEDWLRRYGRVLKADPTVMRKAQLAIYGNEQAGILDRDDRGNLILTYPASGAITEGFLRLGAVLGWGDLAKIPDVPDLHTRLTFLNPSLNNPFAYSATPLVSIPYKVLSALTPGGELVDAVGDRAINGELGAGRTWYEQLLPTPFMRALQLMDDGENTGSVVGSATATAMVNMALNGRLDAVMGDEDRQRLIGDIMQQSRNVLITRMVMGYFLPGAPGMPEIGEDGENVEADFGYQQAGIMSLKEEYRDMLARMGPGAAIALWAEIHPEASVLADAPKTQTAPGAHTTSTFEAAQFVMDNKDFFTGDYSSIAPYVMPEKPGDFSQIAWNALLALHVRQYKTLDKFYLDLMTSQGVNEYYTKKDAADEAIAKARMAGDKTQVKSLQDQWKQDSDLIHQKYPLLAQYQGQGDDRRRNRIARIEKLEQLIADPDAPADVQPQLKGLTQMVQVWRSYNAAHDALKDQRSDRAQAERQNIASQFHDAMRGIVKNYPTLEDAYNGIFRPLVQE